METHDYLTRLVADGWSQSRIAKATDISQPAISRILRGLQQDVRHAQGRKLERLYKQAIAKKKAA